MDKETKYLHYLKSIEIKIIKEISKFFSTIISWNLPLLKQTKIFFRAFRVFVVINGFFATKARNHEI